jgi:V/A-type H+-transporting ATPase subunit I
MITPMKKYAFMVYHKEYDAFLSVLRDLGVVHVKETKSIAGNADLRQMLEEHKQVASLLRRLDSLNKANVQVDPAPARRLTEQEGRKLVHSIEGLYDRKEQLLAIRQSLKKDIRYMELWGEFTYANVNYLKQAGYDVSFYTCPSSRFDPKWVDEYNAIVINNVQSVTYFVTITKETTRVDIDAEYPKMPDRGLAQLKTRYAKREEEIRLADEEIKDFAASQYHTLMEFDKQLQDDFNLSNVIVQTDKQAGDKLMFLEGWTTADKAGELESRLDEGGYLFRQVEAEAGDNVPIQLKNNSYSKLFEPITRMFSLPNYGELDPTPLLAPFFMLFFGLCFGDGGYGLIVMLLCTILKKKVNPDMRPFLSLFQYLGGAALGVGILTGSFFGIALVDIPAFKDIKDYFVNSDNLMSISLVVGVVHILFGKCVSAYKTKVQKGFRYSLSSWAWVFVIVSLLMLFALPAMDIRLPQPVVYVCYGIAVISALVAFLYNSPGKNVFLNFGSGLWTAYNTASGLLGDTLSYIRLFAIGLTGSILGGVFNELAISMTDGIPIVVRIPCALLILLIGHSLNFGLCTISSLVHPVRLIFVEYYKNSEFEGGGIEYLPFKKA